MADNPFDSAVPVGAASSNPFDDATPVGAPAGVGMTAGPAGPDTAKAIEGADPALQAPEIDPVMAAAGLAAGPIAGAMPGASGAAMGLAKNGLPAVMNELARPFIHHYVGENVEKATGSPLAGTVSEIATPLALGNLPRLGGTLAREFAAAPSAQELEDVGTGAAKKAQEALASGKANVAKEAAQAYKKAGEEALDQIAPVAQKKAEDEAVSQISKGVGVNPAVRQKEAEAAFDNPDLARQSAIGRQEAKASAVAPVSRLFKAKGAQIGALLEDHKDLPLSTETMPDTIGSIDTILKKNAYDVSGPVNQELEQARTEGQAGNMTAGQSIGRLNKMQAMVSGLRGGRNEAGDRIVLGNLRDHYENMVDSMVGDLPPATQNEYGKLKSEYGDLKGAFATHGRDIYNQADQPAVAKKLLGLSPDHYGQVLAEANPTEKESIANSMGRYIMGDDAKPDAKDVTKRFLEVRDKNPRAFRELYGDTAFQKADTWADVATKTQKFTDEMRSDPSLAAGWAAGTGLATNSPEAQRLDAAIEKVRQLPKPAQEALRAKVEAIQDGTGGRMYGYIKRRLMFDTLLYGGSAAQYGMLAKNPAFAAGLAGFIGAREVTASMVKNNPETYLNIVKRMNGTVNGLRQAGYFTAKMAAADMARELEDAMTGPQKQQQEQGQ